MREDDSQQYKFRTRAFKIENVIELDISTLGKSLANESFQEWRELVAEDEQRVRLGQLFNNYPDRFTIQYILLLYSAIFELLIFPYIVHRVCCSIFFLPLIFPLLNEDSYMF